MRRSQSWLWLGAGGLAFGLALFALATPAAPQKSQKCPLTDAQTRKAIAAWSKINTFLTGEPRCFNCHGGVNPFIDGTGLDPDDLTLPPSSIEHGGGKQNHEKGVEKECTEACHSNMAPRTGGGKSRWFLAPGIVSFVNKDSVTLCKQVKGHFVNQNRFLGHIKDDNGDDNFTGTVFNVPPRNPGAAGDRALSPEDITTYNVEIGPGPAISHDELLQMGQDWVAAMGGWPGGPSCGCDVVRHNWTGTITYYAQHSGDKSDGSDPLRDWEYYSFAEIAVSVTDGVGSAHQFAMSKSFRQLRHKVANNGNVSIEIEQTDTSDASAGGSTKAEVRVSIDEAKRTYSIVPSWGTVPGQSRSTTCKKDSCTPDDKPFGVQVGNSSISDKLTDPKHLVGRREMKQDNVTLFGKRGSYVTVVTWDLAKDD